MNIENMFATNHLKQEQENTSQLNNMREQNKRIRGREKVH